MLRLAINLTTIGSMALIGMVACGKVKASEWQGFAMTHQHRHFVAPYYGFYPEYGPRAIEFDDGDGGQPTEREVLKAIVDQRTCAPVVLYGDVRIVHPALGCRR